MRKEYSEKILEIMRDKGLSRNEKIEKLKELQKKTEAKYEREYLWKNTLNWSGGAIIIGSSVIPMTTVLKGVAAASKYSPTAAKLLPTLTKTVTKNLNMSKPLLKQILINNIKKSALDGSFSDLTYAIGSSLQEGKNINETIEKIIKNVITGTVFGAVLGGLTSKIGTKIPKFANKIKELDELLGKRKDWGIAFRKASGNPKLAIETLLKYKKGFVPNAFYKEGLGNMDFPWGKHDYITDKGYGIGHIDARRSPQKNLDMDKFWQNFIDTLQNAEVKPDPRFPKDVLIEDTKTRIAVAQKCNRIKGNIPITAYPQNKKVAKRLAALRPKSKPYDSSRTHFTTELSYDNNIPNNSPIVNPQLVKQLNNKIYPALAPITLNVINKKYNSPVVKSIEETPNPQITQPNYPKVNNINPINEVTPTPNLEPIKDLVWVIMDSIIKKRKNPEIMPSTEYGTEKEFYKEDFSSY